MSSRHIPVLPEQTIEMLDPQPGQTLVDGTLGGGGHTRLFAEHLGGSGRIIALDRDPEAIQRGREALAHLPVVLMQADFCELPQVLAGLGLSHVDAILLDLGLSSDQLEDTQRGFSFHSCGPLDLRFNPEQGEPAWRLVNRLGADQLADLIYQYGEERYSRRIARRIVSQRRAEPIRTAQQLADLVRGCVPRRRGRPRIDAATRTFQALRIAVNDELDSLRMALDRLPDCLHPGGKLAIISFHSLEDRLVKSAFRQDGRFEMMHRKPIRPTPEQIRDNPRCRSARLRVARRTQQGW